MAPLARTTPLALALLLSACSGCSTAPRAAAPPPPSPTAPPAGPLGADLRDAEVATVGWDSATMSPVVLLREVDTGQLVPIWVGVAEAQSITAALHEIRYPRPMTADLMADLVARLGGHVDALVIHDVVDGTYFGMLELSVEGRDEPLLVDARPSDGLALALRSGAAIRVAQKILDDTPDIDFLAPDEPEQVVRALGLTVVAPDDALRGELGLPPDRQGLAVIRAVGEAARRGMRRGDLLTEVGGRAAERPVDFLDAVRAAPPGGTVTLRYWRDGEEHETELSAEPGPAEAPGTIARGGAAAGSRRRGGVRA